MYCSVCGKKLSDGATVCLNCGCLVNNATSQSSKVTNKRTPAFFILTALVSTIAIIFTITIINILENL